MKSRGIENCAGAGLFVFALLYYLALAPGFAVPGRGALMVTSFGGLEPLHPYMRPVWSALVAGLAALPVANLAWAVNALTALAGAGCVWLIYAIVRRIPYVRLMPRKDQHEIERWPRFLAGVVAALFALFSLPVMTASTRGDFAMLDILLALASILPLLLYRQQINVGYIYLASFMGGLALIEYPGMIFIAPACLVAWLFLFWKGGWPRLPVYFIALASFLAGASSLAIYLAVMVDGRVAALRDLAGLQPVLFEFAQTYYREWLYSVPKVGWLLMFGMNILPLIFIVGREQDEPYDLYGKIGIYAFRALVFALGVFTLFDLPGSPTRLAEARVLLVAPSFVAAVWFGFLLGYYQLLAQGQKSTAAHRMVPVIAGILLFGAGAGHVLTISEREGAEVAAFADDVIEQLPDKVTYLITDGTYDDMLRLAARKAGREVALVNLAAGSDPDRGRHHATLFDDADLQDAARLGAVPLLRAWMNRDEQFGDRAVFLTSPDLAELQGMTAMPEALFYRVLKTSPDDVAINELLARNESYWRDVPVPEMPELADSSAPGWFHRVQMTRWLSRLSNDLGALLEDAGRDEEALSAYNRALSIWPDNISAALNLLARAGRLETEDEASSLRAMLDQQFERTREQFPPRLIPRLCGRLRGPAALLEEASMLGQARQRDAADERIRRAAALLGEEDAAIQLSLARIYLRDRNLDESEQAFERVLRQHPTDLAALEGMLRVDVLRGRFDEAAARIDELVELGYSKQRARVERANLELARGEPSKAKADLLELLKDEAAPVEAWHSLALIARAEEDEELFQRASARLAAARGFMPGLLLLGDHALREGRFEEAGVFLSRALALEPANISILERLALVTYQLRDATRLREVSGSLLGLDPDHPLGLFGSASVQIAAGRLDLAVRPLQRCLEQADFGPAHNELAYILSLQGDNEQALPHAKRAAELMPEDANALDTLAMIHQRLGDATEAAAVMDRVLELRGGLSAAVLLRAVEIYGEAGNPERASEIIERLERARNALTPEETQELERLRGDAAGM
ncbi:MAG: tetratricopeptide repeat protein [Kiritimatiellia bacterium]